MGLADLEPLKATDLKRYLALLTASRVCAVLLPNTRIPRAVIGAAVQRMGLSERVAVAELVARGLLAEDARTGTVTMAAATQAEVLAGAGDADKLRVRATGLLYGVWPKAAEMRSSRLHLALGRELLPHSVHLVDTCAAEVEEMARVAVLCAVTLQYMDSHAEAVRVQRRVVALGTGLRGAEHPNVLHRRVTLGQMLSRAGWLGEAATVLEETLEAMWRVLGKEHEMTLQCTAIFVEVLRQLGDPRAEEEAARVVANLQRVAGPRAEKTVDAMEIRAMVLWEMDKLEEAEATLRSVLEARTARFGAGHTDSLAALYNLALIRRDRGHLADTACMLRRVVKGRERVRGRAHPDTNKARYLLSLALTGLGELDEARALLQQLAAMPAGQRLADEHIAKQLGCIDALEQDE